jgi:hypothetical protein
VVKRGGVVISLSGPPDRDFARREGAGWLVRVAVWLMGRKVYAASAKAGAAYCWFFTEANGDQLHDIATLEKDGVLSKAFSSPEHLGIQGGSEDWVQVISVMTALHNPVLIRRTLIVGVVFILVILKSIVNEFPKSLNDSHILNPDLLSSVASRLVAVRLLAGRAKLREGGIDDRR